MNNLCQLHGQTITHICVFNHDCQRLMCPDCQFTHQKIVPGSKIFPVSIFNETLNSTINNDSQVNQSQIEKEMKMHFEEILQSVYTLSEKAQNKFNYLFGEITQRDNSYLELFNNKPLEMSLKDLNKIINIWHNKILDKWKQQKEIIITILLKKINLIQNFLQKIINILDNQINQCIEEISTKIEEDSPFSYEAISFPVFFGIKHGQTFCRRQGTYEEYGYIRLNDNLDILNQTGFILHKQKLLLTPFQILKQEDYGQLQYLRNGVILKTEKIPNINENIIINRNLEQVQHLTWEGQYGLQMQKVGLWNAYWQGKKLDVGGIYDEVGLKKGQWIELSDIYQNQCQVTETGNYQKGKKSGIWKILYKGQRIGGGSYNEQQEVKVGFWKEIHQNFHIKNQIFYIGEYENGKKIGNWDIRIRDETTFQYKKIGGGLYDDQNGWKDGQWEELYNQYQDINEFTQKGLYQKGKKDGKWDIYLKDNVIGGGIYGKEGKINKWIEPISNQITCEGHYKNGQKNGEWTIKFENEKIGGGDYYNGLKNNVWTEISEKYNKNCQITRVGEYNNGKKCGIWEIYHRNIQIGEGSYEDGQKSGFWIEVHENFQDAFQILQEGQYCQGRKFGFWNSKLKKSQSETFISIGGGNYYNGLKIGQWIEFDLNYEKINQITYNGKYQDGKKIDIWDIKIQNRRIGGGSYMITGQKDGEWIELDDNFRDLSQIVHRGVYQNGIKVGNWIIQLIDQNNFVNIGGGQYSDKGEQIGKWTELYQNFWKDCRVIFKGEYKNGRKEGEWQSYYQNDLINNNYEIFGGGSYNQGMKVGKWFEFEERTWNPQQFIIVQSYDNGIIQNQNQ